LTAVFISGTDTDCGKTAVGVALATAARNSRPGFRVRVLKPIETGCVDDVAEDARKLAAAAADDRPADAICPYRLKLPAAPSVAAEVEDEKLELEVIQRAYREAEKDADLLIVEGAGGLRVPILPGLDMVGLIRALDLPLLLVARAKLGTINHTLLSLEVARHEGIEVAGVVISHTTPDLSEADRQNLDALLGALNVPFLTELPFQEGPAPQPSPDFGNLLHSLAQQ
jgi:dethiobiotin synthetase